MVPLRQTTAESIPTFCSKPLRSTVVDAPIADASAGLPEAAPPSNADIVQLAAGSNFTCVRRTDGTVNCWGRNTEGELGTGTLLSSSLPSVVVSVSDAMELSVGLYHSCILVSDGSVECWGRNDSRQLGNGATTNTAVPTVVVGLTQPAKHISAGAIFSCAHLADDTAMCWGDNTQGELGDGTTTAHTTPVAVKGLTGITQLVTISQSACALVKDSTVWCWGDNPNGQNGIAGPDLATATQIVTAKLSNVVSLAAGATGAHFCAVLGDGTSKCWGAGTSGQLGGSGASDSPTPVAVTTLDDAASVVVGNNFSCALHKDASVSCWGSNANSDLALGDSPTPSATTPLPTKDLAGVIALAAGVSHACALKDAQNVLCWGSDQYGALGRKRALIVPTPVQVANISDVAELGVGREFACVTHADGGTLSCWGNNFFHQQARSDFSITGVPSTVPNVAGVSVIATGETTTCVVASGSVLCFGEDDQGEVGNGMFIPSQNTPAAFQGPFTASNVGAGQALSCAVTLGNQVYCAGYNADQRLGRPTPANGSSSTPGAVLRLLAADAGPDAAAPALGNVNVLGVGREGACAVYDAHARVACWGNNSDGQLGTTGNNRSYPADVTTGARTPVLTRMGYRHTCGVFDPSGQVVCWGRNANGQLTGADAVGSSVPRQVNLGDAGAQDVALGDDHTCALMADGTVQCWGAGTQGQLGTGVLADSITPLAVPGIIGATAIRAQENHTCVVTPAGVWCWGTDYAGQLGVSPTMQTGTPAAVQGL